MNSTSEEQSISPGATAVYCVIMGAILATAIFGNCLVLLAVKRTRSLRNTAAVLVVNLACVDLAVTVFIVPFVIVTASAHRWVLSSALCIATGFMNSFLTAAQIMALLHISLNRFLAVSYPHSYDTKLSKRLTLMMVAAGWVYSFFWTHMPFYGWGSIGFIDGTLFCNILWSRELSFAVTAQALCYFLPCSIAGVLYLLTYLNVRKHWKRAKVRTQSTLSLGDTNTGLAVTQSMEALAAPVTPSIEDLATTPVTQSMEKLDTNQSNEKLEGNVTHSTDTLATLVTQSAENLTDPVTQSASSVTQSVLSSAENVEGQSITQVAENATHETSQCVTQPSDADTPQVTRKSVETVTTPVTEDVTKHTVAVTAAVTASETTDTQPVETTATCTAIDEAHPVTQSSETAASAIDDDNVTQTCISNEVITLSDETLSVIQTSEPLDVVTQPSDEEPLVTQSNETTVTQNESSLSGQQTTSRTENETSSVTFPVTQTTEATLVTHENGTIPAAPVTQSTETPGSDTCNTSQCTKNTSSEEKEPVTQAIETESVTNQKHSVTQPNGVGPVTQCNGNGPVTQSNGVVIADVTPSKEAASTPIVHFAAASAHNLEMTFLEEGNLKTTGDVAKAARKRRRRRRAMENRVTKTLLGVAIAFAVCWFPRGIANLWALFAGRDKVPLGLEFASTAFVFLNSSVNPAIYGALNQDFYKAFISILSCEKVKRSRSDTELGSGSFSYARRI